MNKKENLNRQIAGVMVALVVGIVSLCLILNTCFLGSYYISNKQKSMRQAYNTLNELAEKGIAYDQEGQIQMERMAASEGLSFMVISSDAAIVMSSMGDSADVVHLFLSNLINSGNDEGEVLESNSNYMIQRLTDSRMQEEYLVLMGTLDDGNMVMIRSAVEGIRESASVANRFLLYVGLLAVFVTILIAEKLSGLITRPLKRLTDISKKMTELDFNARYVPQKNRNEIDVLGERMNEMSSTLEQTIKDLKQANLELQQGMEQKEKNEAMRTEFISNVSHELKTPIALILGYGEGLQEGIASDNESRMEYYDVIVDEARKMERLVQELLALNKLESGGRKLEMERFDLMKLIQGVVSSSALLLEQKGVEVRIMPKGEVYIWADEFFTEQVVNNYISNAIHYVDGEKKIMIRCDATDHGTVRLGVFNTGQPIPEDAVPHLWDKFYKVDKARTREYGGSGIGLSIVKAVMDSFHKPYGV